MFMVHVTISKFIVGMFVYKDNPSDQSAFLQQGKRSVNRRPGYSPFPFLPHSKIELICLKVIVERKNFP
jgi:hypothetical protein